MECPVADQPISGNLYLKVLPLGHVVGRRHPRLSARVDVDDAENPRIGRQMIQPQMHVQVGWKKLGLGQAMRVVELQPQPVRGGPGVRNAKARVVNVDAAPLRHVLPCPLHGYAVRLSVLQGEDADFEVETVD